MSTFTATELEYLRSQRLGRLATLRPDGTLQNSPVGFFLAPDGRTIDVGGHGMGRSRKWANVRANGQVALVVDDLVSVRPWRVRCVEIRGTAESLEDVEPPAPGFSREVLRIHPRRVISFGLEGDRWEANARDVA